MFDYYDHSALFVLDILLLIIVNKYFIYIYLAARNTDNLTSIAQELAP
jgi:hypothetical protein